MATNQNLKVLMFGWEFPPFNNGGLGVACRGLVSHFSEDIQTTLVLPKTPKQNYSGVNFLEANFNRSNTEVKQIDSFLSSYTTEKDYKKTLSKNKSTLTSTDQSGQIYGKNLFSEIKRYANVAGKIARQENFDLIHTHDWLTFLAGIEAKKISGKPLLAHVHATEFDRAAGHGIDERTYQIEKKGFRQADQIIAVSNRTKDILEEKYNTSEKKISVVHNGIDESRFDYDKLNNIKLAEKDVVLFLGRITLQKYPTGFVKAAKKVLQQKDDVIFIMAGDGDLKEKIIEQAAEARIADKFLFPGFVTGKDISKLYQAANLFVMPSVSEPFGLTALEAMIHKTPILVSKQSGVSEILNHGLKADFWDIEAIADKILSVLKHDSLQKKLAESGKKEASCQTWYKVADQCQQIYQHLV